MLLALQQGRAKQPNGHYWDTGDRVGFIHQPETRCVLVVVQAAAYSGLGAGWACPSLKVQNKGDSGYLHRPQESWGTGVRIMGSGHFEEERGPRVGERERIHRVKKT